MTRYFFFLLIAFCFLISACGSKTSPKVKSNVERSLPTISETKAWFKVNTLILSWNLPEGVQWEPSNSKMVKKDRGSQVSAEQKASALDFIQVFIHQNDKCLACERIETVSIRVYQNSLAFEQDGKLKTLEGVDLIRGEKKKSFRLKFSEEFYKQFLSKDGSAFSIGYQTTDKKLAAVSEKITYKRPLDIPIPQIQYRVEWVEQGQKFSKKNAKVFEKQSENKMKLLYLSWTPENIGAFHTIDGSGAIWSQKKYLGVYFYYKNKSGTLIKINKNLKYEGSFLILNFYFPLYATYVDLYGNESKMAYVYDGTKK